MRRSPRPRALTPLSIATTTLLATSIVLAAQVAGLGVETEGVRRGDADVAAIVFVRTEPDVINGALAEIWTMGRRGGNQVRLTRSDAYDAQPEWSPDGTQIAWIRYATRRGGPSDVWVMNADGSNKRNLTGDGPEEIVAPAWSPDGTQIAIDRNDYLWIMNADGTGAHEIGTSPIRGGDPAWSPDGSKIAYIGSAPTGAEIFMMDADGSDSQQLTSTARVHETRPAWSPDGSRIVYAGAHTSLWHVDMMRSDGTGRHVVIDENSLDPAWSPDGSKIAFHACVEGQCRLFQSSWRGRHMQPLGRRHGISEDISSDFREVIPTA